MRHEEGTGLCCTTDWSCAKAQTAAVLMASSTADQQAYGPVMRELQLRTLRYHFVDAIVDQLVLAEGDSKPRSQQRC